MICLCSVLIDSSFILDNFIYVGQTSILYSCVVYTFCEQVVFVTLTFGIYAFFMILGMGGGGGGGGGGISCCDF